MVERGLTASDLVKGGLGAILCANPYPGGPKPNNNPLTATEVMASNQPLLKCGMAVDETSVPLTPGLNPGP